MRVAQIARDSLDDESDEVVRTLSIRSMAGMMVARLGVLREKNRVTSLKTYAKNVNRQRKNEGRITHLEDVSKLHGDLPFKESHLVLAKVKPTDRCHRIDGIVVSDCKVEHVERRVPASRNVLRHHAWRKALSRKRPVPGWQENGCRVLEHYSNLSELHSKKRCQALR